MHEYVANPSGKRQFIRQLLRQNSDLEETFRDLPVLLRIQNPAIAQEVSSDFQHDLDRDLRQPLTGSLRQRIGHERFGLHGTEATEPSDQLIQPPEPSVDDILSIILGPKRRDRTRSSNARRIRPRRKVRSQ